MILSNPETHHSTCAYNVNIGNLCDTKEITELSNRHRDYVSVLVLPFQKTQVNEDIKYYLFNENHYEYNENGTWMSPRLMPVNIHNEFERNVTWLNRSHCEMYIGKKVLPLEGKYDGTVTSFHYKRGLIRKETATWTVKYRKKSCNSSNRYTYKRVQFCYDELIDIII